MMIANWGEPRELVYTGIECIDKNEPHRVVYMMVSVAELSWARRGNTHITIRYIDAKLPTLNS